ncbi:MAG TPA: glycosyltransferase [Caulobacteraceae bacterium]|nr:glycosyltransferase [Caulobacteraceae bacterium]
MTEALAHRADRPAMSEEDQATFFAATLERAREAEARTGVRERFIAVADATVRLVFAGEALERVLFAALAHLEVEAAAPDATIHVWDSETSGIEAPPAPCGRDCYTDRGDIWGMTSRRFRSAFHWAEFSLNLLDAASGEAVFWVRTPKTLPYWTRASPFRTLLHWLMEARGKQLLHAAAVSTKDGAVLIAGRGGVGKSSTALACLEAGFGYLGDDYVVVGLDPEPTVFSLYNTAKLDQAERFPKLAAMIAETPGTGEKTVLRLHPDRADQIVLRAAIKTILTPRFGDGGPTRFEPVDTATLSRAAAFTTLAQLPHAGLATHDFIGRMIGAVPSRSIVLSRDGEEIARSIAGLLADPPSEVAAAGAGVARDAPLLSVIVPVHNGARFLAEAIGSVLAQAYPRLEIIVVDDGSTDEIEDTVRGLPVDVRFLRQNNLGAAAARNRGYREAAGELIAFLDVDDLWPDGALDAMLRRLIDGGFDVVQGHGQLFSREGAAPVEYLSHPGESFPYYIGAAVFRRSALETVGLFDESLRFSEDTDWFVRAREAGLVTERLDQATLLVRRHAGNMTRGKSLVEVNALRVFKKALDRRRGQ